VITALRGVTLFVPEVAKVRDFYAETLALDIASEQDEVISFDLGGAMLCLDSRGDRKKTPTGHSLWFQTDSFQSLADRLEAARTPVVRGPEKSTGNGKWFIVVRDPAGCEVRIDES